MKYLDKEDIASVQGGVGSLIIKSVKWAAKKIRRASKSKTVASIGAISEVQSVRHSGHQK